MLWNLRLKKMGGDGVEKTIFRRLKTLEKECGIAELNGRLAELIDAGVYYDELTDDEKNAYCRYQKCEREALETLNGYILGNLHFQLERRPKPPTEEEFRANVREIEEAVEEYKRQYNTPEARAKREAEYMKMKQGVTV